MQKIALDLIINGEPERQIIVMRTGESLEHIAMKILSYILYHDRKPQIEASADQHYKPDLLCMEGYDVTLWIDVGDTAIRKLDKIATKNKRAEIVIVKANKTALAAYKRHADRRIKYPRRIRYITFTGDLVGRMAAQLKTRNRIEARLDHERRALRLQVNEQALEGQVVDLESSGVRRAEA